MRKILFLLLFLPIYMIGQNASPNMYEALTIEVKRGMEDKFEEAVKSHNAKYHKDSLYEAQLAYNISGPNGGTYTWIMGPTNWGGMDSRPSDDGHEDDWKNVDQYVESYGSPSYWMMSEKLSHWVEGTNKDKRMIWAFNIKRNKSSRWAELVAKIKEVYEEKLPDESYLVVWNSLSQGNDGYDAAMIFGFDMWGVMDRQRDFGAMYEEVHGNGSWHTFLNDFTDTVEERVDWTRRMID